MLGPHRRGDGRWAVRTVQPTALRVHVLHRAVGRVPMRRLHPDGVFEALLPGEVDRDAYLLLVEEADGTTRALEDPYRFPSTLGELDRHLLAEGTDRELYRKLGAHPWTIGGVPGVRFVVWAPHARRVSVVGDVNRWDGRVHPMRFHPGAGLWELFLPGLGEGALYKYEILPRQGPPFLKADPVAFRAELRPGTASIVHALGRYRWHDDAWLARRGAVRQGQAPMSIYEVHLGSWRRHPDGRWATYRELAPRLADYLEAMGFTHVELMPILEHPYDASWGYQVTGYFAPTARYGSPDDFKFFVDHLHQRGFGVILDWVPAHFPADAHGLRRFDGTALYEHEDPRRGVHPDWGTLIFDYGRPQVRNFLLANALFWLEEYHIDALRVDAVASMLYLDYSRAPGEWVPNPFGGRENLEAIAFLQELHRTLHERVPDAFTVAEESTAWPGVTHPVERGGLGFDFKWNMGWMNDTLRFFRLDPGVRKYHLNLLTFSLVYAFHERFLLPLSHDEVVHGKGSLLGKMPGDRWQRFAHLRLLLGWQWTHPGPPLLFMGGEFGMPEEWSEARALPWERLADPLHAGVQRWVRDLNGLLRAHPALWARDASGEGFRWIDLHDAENTVLAFLRQGASPEERLVVVANFTPVPRHGYRVGVPDPGAYRERLNSDALDYGGSGLGNLGRVEAQPVPMHGYPYSLALTLPPLGLLVLEPERPGARLP